MKLLSFFPLNRRYGIAGRTGTTKVEALEDELYAAGLRAVKHIGPEEYCVHWIVDGKYRVDIHYRYGARGLPYAWLTEL